MKEQCVKTFTKELVLCEDRPSHDLIKPKTLTLTLGDYFKLEVTFDYEEFSFVDSVFWQYCKVDSSLLIRDVCLSMCQ